MFVTLAFALSVALPQLDCFVVFESSRCDNVLSRMACSAQNSVGVTL